MLYRLDPGRSSRHARREFPAGTGDHPLRRFAQAWRRGTQLARAGRGD